MTADDVSLNRREPRLDADFALFKIETCCERALSPWERVPRKRRVRAKMGPHPALSGHLLPEGEGLTAPTTSTPSPEVVSGPKPVDCLVHIAARRAAFPIHTV